MEPLKRQWAEPAIMAFLIAVALFVPAVIIPHIAHGSNTTSNSITSNTINATTATAKTTVTTSSTSISSTTIYPSIDISSIINSMEVNYSKMLNNPSSKSGAFSKSPLENVAYSFQANTTNVSGFNTLALSVNSNKNAALDIEHMSLILLNYSTGRIKTLNTSSYIATSNGLTNIISVNIKGGTFNPIIVNYSQSGFSSIYVDPTSDYSNVTVNVTAQSTALRNVPAFSGPVYRYIQLNSTLSDANIAGAKYDFYVNRTWISSLGISAAQVGLFKLVGGSWAPLQTSLIGSNSTSYEYEAYSNSFSTYLVSYSTNAVAGDANHESVTLPTGYKLYLCEAGANYTFSKSGTAISWASDISAPSGAPINNGANASIGHQASNVCSAYTTNASYPGLAVAGIGVNETDYSLYKSASGSSTSASLSYTVATGNSFVIIMAAAGYFDLSGVTLPSGCVKAQFVNNTDRYESAYIATCQNQPAGSYSVSATLSSLGSSAIAAYVFTQHNVVLDDNPTAATITTNGATYASGSPIQVIGTNAITANPPGTGSWAFNSWSISNSIGLTIASPLSPSTSLTVSGNGIVTATWNGITKFLETGLPSGTAWNVVYNNIQNSSTTSVLSFSTAPGNYSFTIANQTVKGVTYLPGPPSGNIIAANATSISFTAEYKAAACNSGKSNLYVSSTASKHLKMLFGCSLLSSIGINATSTGLSFNLTVHNQSTPFPSTSSLPGAYQYVQLNETNTTQNIDSYVQSATYNFSVPKAWVQSQGISDGNIKLFKYSNGAWGALTTAFTGSNSTYYFYSATSNSLSVYAVGITSSSTSGSPTSSSPLSLTMTGSYPQYFWSGAYAQPLDSHASAASVNYTLDSNLSEAVTSGPPKSQYASQAFIGHSTALTATITTGAGSNTYGTIAGIGANVILANGAIYQYNVSSTTASLSFTPSTSNSFAIIAYASGGATISSQTAPSGCTQQKTISDTYVTSEIYTCSALPASSQTASASTSASASIAIVAYVFPQYMVTLDDSPSTGSISLGGATYTNGQAASIIGTTTLNAIVPAGDTFSSWSGASSNIIIASTSSSNTTVTVEGTGTITANYASAAQTCQISLSPSTIGFGSLNPGSSTHTSNSVTDTNSGNANANVLVSGTDWISGSNSFGVSNTLWSSASQSSYTGTALTSTSTITGITVAGSSSTANIYFGVGVPSQTLAGSYAQTITIENTC